MMEQFLQSLIITRSLRLSLVAGEDWVRVLERVILTLLLVLVVVVVEARRALGVEPYAKGQAGGEDDLGREIRRHD